MHVLVDGGSWALTRGFAGSFKPGVEDSTCAYVVLQFLAEVVRGVADRAGKDGERVGANVFYDVAAVAALVVPE